jgi:threonine/homoserine/homoserine lactone efflux protein
MPAFVPALPVILAFAFAALVLAITPGPDMALFLSRAINHGRRHGIAAMLGAMTGLMVHSTLAAFGISLLIAAAPPAFWALKLSGALYLVWLAIGAVRSGSMLELNAALRSRPSLTDSYFTGLGINLLNPKIILFFVTFLPQFVDRHDPAATGKLFFLGMEFIAIGIPVMLCAIAAADWLVRLLTRRKWIGRVLNWIFAGVFTAFAATILLAEGRR